MKTIEDVKKSYRNIKWFFKHHAKLALEISWSFMWYMNKKELRLAIAKNTAEFLRNGHVFLICKVCPEILFEEEPQLVCEFNPSWVFKHHPEVMLQFRPFWVMHNRPNYGMVHATELMHKYFFCHYLYKCGIIDLPDDKKTDEYLVTNAPAWSAWHIPHIMVTLDPKNLTKHNPDWVKDNKPNLLQKYAAIPDHIFNDMESQR